MRHIQLSPLFTYLNLLCWHKCEALEITNRNKTRLKLDIQLFFFYSIFLWCDVLISRVDFNHWRIVGVSSPLSLLCMLTKKETMVCMSVRVGGCAGLCRDVRVGRGAGVCVSETTTDWPSHPQPTVWQTGYSCNPKFQRVSMRVRIPLLNWFFRSFVLNTFVHWSLVQWAFPHISQ